VSDAAVTGWIQAVAERLRAALEQDGAVEVDYVCLLGSKLTGESEIADFYDARALKSQGRSPRSRST
jgi:hypothetical protein